MRFQKLRINVSRIDRATLLLGFLLFLFLWDVAYFLGIRNPSRFPHPFVVFRRLPYFASLRGLPAMLREVIFCFGSGLIVGIGFGALVLLNTHLVKPFSRFLRLILWWPAFVSPFGAGVFFAETMTAILSACYHYAQGRAVLGLERRGSWIYAAREALLQTLLISLISQLWVSRWQWVVFSTFMEVRQGFEAFAMLAALIGLVNWCFHADF